MRWEKVSRCRCAGTGIKPSASCCSRNAKGNAESDEQGRNVPKSASVADCPVVALKCL